MNNEIRDQINRLLKSDPDITEYQILSIGNSIGKGAEYSEYIKANPDYRNGDLGFSYTTKTTRDTINDTLRINEVPKSAKDSADVFNGINNDDIDKNVLDDVKIELPSSEVVTKKDIEDATDRFLNTFTSKTIRDTINDSLSINEVPKSAKDSADIFNNVDNNEKVETLVPYEKPVETLVPYEKPVETLVPYEKSEEQLVPTDKVKDVIPVIKDTEKDSLLKKVVKKKGFWKKVLVPLTVGVIILGTVIGISHFKNKKDDVDKAVNVVPDTKQSEVVEQNDYKGLALGDKVELKELKGMVSSMDNDTVSLLTKDDAGINGDLHLNKWSVLDNKNNVLETSTETGKTEKGVLIDYVNATQTDENKNTYLDLINNVKNEDDLNKIEQTLGINVKVHVGEDKVLGNNTAGENPYAWENVSNVK